MRQLIVLLVLFSISGCNPSPSYKWSDKPLSDGEKKALAAVMDVYQQNNISVLNEYGTERQVVGAQMTIKPCQCDMEVQDKDTREGHEHDHDMQKVSYPEGHLFTLVTKALIAPKKEDIQPTINMGENVYFYKIPYIATVDDKTLTMRKTVAIEDATKSQSSSPFSMILPAPLEAA